MKDPLAIPAAAIAAGILVSRFAAFTKLELCSAGAAFLLLGGVAVYRKSRTIAIICCGLAFVAAGALTALLHAPPPRPHLDAGSREVVILAGCVVEPPAVAGERERFILELEPGARAQVTLYTREGETLPALSYGQNVEVEARVREPRNFGNPGAFDYAGYLARKDIYWTASGPAGAVRALPGRCGSAFQAAIMGLRTAALDRISLLFPDPYAAGMMQAVLFGQTYQLQKVWTEDYRSTGTFHALVISGAHIAILAAFFLFVLRICFVPEGAALLATVLAAWLYALVTGWQAPCVRAAAGLTLYMIGGYFYRERRAINLLAAVAIAFLLFDPAQLFEASFQLTFLAVGFLAVFAVPLIRATSGPLARGLHDLGDAGRDPYLPPRAAQFRIEMRLLAVTAAGLLRLPLGAARVLIAAPARAMLYVYEVVATSAVVQLGLALPMVIYFHRIGLSGLSANAFVVPIMSLVVPLGFVAVLTGSSAAAGGTGLLLSLSQRVVAWHAALEPQWRVPDPPAWLGLALAAALLGAALARGKWQRGSALALVGMLLTLLIWSPFPADASSGSLEMTMIDVGQGESIFLGLPDGRRVLLDGGGFPTYGREPTSRLDIGEDVVAPYLWGRGIRRLDVVIASHGHEDHIGGLPAVVTAFRPKELWLGGEPHGPAWKPLLDAAARAGARVIPMRAPRRFVYGGTQFEVLAPFADFVPSGTPKNNDSLALRLSYGRHSFLLTGDIEGAVERRMLYEAGVERAAVLKTPHHGSRSSSTNEFLDAVSPMFAAISAGYENSYGNPHPEVLERLSDHGAIAYCTDQDGLITIRTDGHRLELETNRQRGQSGVMPAW